MERIKRPTVIQEICTTIFLLRTIRAKVNEIVGWINVQEEARKKALEILEKGEKK